MAKKIHVEIMPANWKRLERYIKGYNEDDERSTPRIKYAHVINDALVHYFSVPRGKKKGGRS